LFGDRSVHPASAVADCALPFQDRQQNEKKSFITKHKLGLRAALNLLDDGGTSLLLR
jgi:hypothetical protein